MISIVLYPEVGNSSESPDVARFNAIITRHHGNELKVEEVTLRVHRALRWVKILHGTASPWVWMGAQARAPTQPRALMALAHYLNGEETQA